MASVSEAFEKFSMWKNLKTPLRVTVIEGGSPVDVLQARVYGVDPEAGLVGVVGSKMHSFTDFDVSEAEFSIGPKRVSAARNDSDWLVFEESLE